MDGYIRQDYQNGSYNDGSFHLFPDAQDPEISWDLNSLGNEPHNQWQQPAATTPGMESYARQYSKSPSAMQTNANFNYGSSRQFTQSPYDPSLAQPTSIGDPSSSYMGHSPYTQQTIQHTIAPQALQHGQQTQFSRSTGNMDGQGYLRIPNALNSEHVLSAPSATSVDQAALCAVIPRGELAGLFSIIDYDKLVSATNSKKAGPFVNVGQQEYEYPINQAIVPLPEPRKSRKELRELAKNDPELLAQLGKKHHRKSNAAFPTKEWQPTPGIKYEGDSSSEYSSSDESDSDYSEDELAEPSPLPAKRPDHPVEAVKYDTMKALWRSKRFQVDSTEIRTGLKDFWEVVRTIRDRWKKDTSTVIEAEEKKKIGELPLLRSRVKDQRDMFEAALQAALQYGHRSILELFGENASFLYVAYQFLLDRYKSDDFDGPLTHAILEILAHCTTLGEEKLEKTKLGKVYARFANKGTSEIQALVKRIDANVAEYKNKKVDASGQKPVMVTNGEVKAEDVKMADVKATNPLPASRPTPEPVAGIKRAAPAGAISNVPTKRVAPGPASPVSTASTNTSKAAPAVKRAIPNANRPSTAVLSAASKPKAVATKPSGSILATGAGVKKPVNAKPGVPSVLAKAIKSIEKKAGAPATATAPARPAFSFAETMANLTKPKEKEPTPKPEERRAPETAEQRAKRIRREQRRKLRVTFKPDHQLVEVRLFNHDVEEELGHEASMIRDVSDVGGEGRMFKQHQDMMDVDDDDEPGEENVRPYSQPSLTDFSTVDLEERKRNYSPYGGGELQPESPEREIREQYEANTLMAYDSPPYPREPADPYNGESVVTKDFGAPDAQSIVATRAARFTQQPTPHHQPPVASSTPDISAILAIINPQQQQQQQQSLPIHGQAPPQMTDIQRILANLPPTGSQHHQQAPSQLPQSAVIPDIASILANLQPQGIVPSTVIPVQQSGQVPPAIGMGMPDPTNLAAILGQLGQGQNNGGSASQIGNFGHFGFPGTAFDSSSFGQSLQQVQAQDNEERGRRRERDEEESSSQGRKWNKKGGKDKRYTLPCKYYQTGKCQKGAACTYLHE